MTEIEIKPIREPRDYCDKIERRIAELFKKEIYVPLMKEVGGRVNTLTNATYDLATAIMTGRIYFNRGQFKGRFNSVISRELKQLGAKWDRKQGTWKIPLGSLPMDIRSAISASNHKFEMSVSKIDKQIQQFLPEVIADKLKISDLFDAALWKIDREMVGSVKGITVVPKLTPERAKVISEEYQQNMKLYIKDFTEKEIVSLREKMQKSAFNGDRYESMIKTIQKSYGVSHNKAKFLARQETNLLMTKFKETRYQEAGVNKYKWSCVAGSKNHPVRPMHKKLDGKIFSFDNPPITDENGSRNNPGQDYNCRCVAIPIVRFK